MPRQNLPRPRLAPLRALAQQQGQPPAAAPKPPERRHKLLQRIGTTYSAVLSQLATVTPGDPGYPLLTSFLAGFARYPVAFILPEGRNPPVGRPDGGALAVDLGSPLGLLRGILNSDHLDVLERGLYQR